MNHYFRCLWSIALLFIASILIAACGREDESTTESSQSPLQAPAQEQVSQQAAATSTSAATRPNFLVLISDDMGYTDLGAFGSEIPTPNLDQLALNGIRFNNFHAAPSCAPTRAMLMSGTGNHEAGMGSQMVRPEYVDQWGFEHYLHERIAALPEVLQADGYHTYWAGKWHIGRGDPTGNANPGKRGFERAFALLGGGDGHVESVLEEVSYSEDGELLAENPRDFYSTNLYVDKLLEFMKSNEGDGTPFLAWIAPTAPHWPLQPHPDWIDKHAGAYEQGFDELCQRRLSGAQKAGIIPENAITSSCHKQEDAWQDVSEENKKIYRRTMELYAAMVEHLDHEFGRIVSYLRESGQLDNTYIIYMNDNGPQGGNFFSRTGSFPLGKDNSFENLGKAGSWINHGAGWADATSAPFAYTKAKQYEGGIRVPAFVWHSQIAEVGSVNTQLLTAMDMMPTILDLAGTAKPGSIFKEREVLPMRGKSFASILTGSQKRIHEPDEVIALDSAGRSVLFRDDWKLVKELNKDWELFSMSEDPSEARDLSEQMAELRSELISVYQQQAKISNHLERQ